MIRPTRRFGVVVLVLVVVSFALTKSLLPSAALPTALVATAGLTVALSVGAVLVTGAIEIARKGDAALADDYERGAVQLVDVIMSLIVLVGIIATAPFWYQFVDMLTQSADPFTGLLLQLAVPLLLIALLLSVGASARRTS